MLIKKCWGKGPWQRSTLTNLPAFSGTFLREANVCVPLLKYRYDLSLWISVMGCLGLVTKDASPLTRVLLQIKKHEAQFESSSAEKNLLTFSVPQQGFGSCCRELPGEVRNNLSRRKQ